VWEAQGQDPAYGDKFTFTPTNSGLEWVEVEAELPRWPASVRFRKYHGPLVHGREPGKKDSLVHRLWRIGRRWTGAWRE
jgi:hypothetical protein